MPRAVNPPSGASSTIKINSFITDERLKTTLAEHRNRPSGSDQNQAPRLMLPNRCSPSYQDFSRGLFIHFNRRIDMYPIIQIRLTAPRAVVVTVRRTCSQGKLAGIEWIGGVVAALNDPQARSDSSGA